MFIRADHPYYNADQLMRHEIGHDMIARGEVDINSVKERIERLYGEENVKAIADAYAEAYEGSGLTADEIWEEIVCDSLGDMNIFAPLEALGEMNSEFLSGLKREVRKDAKNERGPPKHSGETSNFSIETEPIGGERFVAVEKASISKLMQLPGNSLSAKVRSFMKQYRGEVLPLGSTDQAYMRREAEGEYTNPAKLVSENDYKGKLNAASELKNLLKAAEFVRHSNDNGRHPDATRGWNYYKISYVVPISDTEIRAYSGEIQIKLIDRGDCFYDITKIKDITDGSAGQAFIKAAGSVYDVSNNSISQKSDLSTKKLKKDPDGSGKASRELDVDSIDYRNFGWVRENDVISAGYWTNFTENFAQAVAGKNTYPKTKNGEFMISVYNVYDDPAGAADVIVFASGTIDSPNVTKIVKINLTNDVDIETKRRVLYEAERRGIQQETGELFRFYNKADFVSEFGNKRIGNERNGNNNRLDAKRSRSERKADRITQFHVDEDNNTITYTYANGETVTESLGKASRELDFIDYINDNEATETKKKPKKLSNREILATALESVAKKNRTHASVIVLLNL